MDLLEIVRKLNNIDSELTIYMKKPWSINSYCEIAFEPDDGSYPQELKRSDLEYFLEVFIAKEFLLDWSISVNKVPTAEEQATRLINYAENDA